MAGAAINCAECGVSNRAQARFCSGCGRVLAVTDVVCPHCDEANPLGARFCNQCGGALPAGDEWACPECGVLNLVAARFCQGCGLAFSTDDVGGWGRSVAAKGPTRPARNRHAGARSDTRTFAATGSTPHGTGLGTDTLTSRRGASAGGHSQPSLETMTDGHRAATGPSDSGRGSKAAGTSPVQEGGGGGADPVSRNGRRLLWWYMPPDSLLHSPSFRAMMLMRVASEMAVNALTYGMLIEVVKNTRDVRLIGILAALVTVCTVAPAAVFGPLGGVVVDRFPKRRMLVAANIIRASLCIGFFLFGTGNLAIYGLLISLTVVTQFATPAEAAIVPLVAPGDRLATANSFGNLAESVGALLGTAVIAPVMVKLPGSPESLIAVCAALLVLASVQALAIQLTMSEPVTAPSGAGETDTVRKPWLAGTREALAEAWQWLAGDRPAFICMMLLVLAATANLVMVTLAPRFTSQALGVDPEFAVFVFGPAVAGVLFGLFVTPKLAHVVEKRLLVTVGFMLMVVVLLLFGGINGVTELLKGAGLVGNVFKEGPLGYKDGRLGTALLLAFPLGFGMSMVQVSAQTLLHERVPREMQGRVFALQGAVKNATAILPLLALGGLASLLGDVRPVLMIAAFLIMALALYGAARSGQWTAKSSRTSAPESFGAEASVTVEQGRP